MGVAIALLFLGCGIAGGEPLPAPLVVEETARAERAIDPDSLRLADGRIVRLAAILGPHPPLGRESGRPWPIADEARKALDALIAGKDLGLAFDARRSDRYGRLVAHAVVAGAWVQGEMLTQGFARVETAPDMRAVAREMGVELAITTNQAMGQDFNPRNWRVTRAQCQTLAGGVVGGKALSEKFAKKEKEQPKPEEPGSNTNPNAAGGAKSAAGSGTGLGSSGFTASSTRNARSNSALALGPWRVKVNMTRKKSIRFVIKIGRAHV